MTCFGTPPEKILKDETKPNVYNSYFMAGLSGLVTSLTARD